MQCEICHRYKLEDIVTCEGCNTTYCGKCQPLHEKIAGAHRFENMKEMLRDSIIEAAKIPEKS